MDTLDEPQKLRLWVDSLEAAWHFNDFTPCLDRLRAEHGEMKARAVVLALAVRLWERGRAA